MFVCVCVFSVKPAFPLYLKVSQDTLGVSRGSPGIAPVSWWWHYSRRRSVGALAGSRGLVVASLEEVRGVLWWVGGDITRGDAVGCPGGLLWVGGGITQGDAGIALTF